MATSSFRFIKGNTYQLRAIQVTTDKQGKAVTTEDLGVAGAMTILLKDAIKPNILQTLEDQALFSSRSRPVAGAGRR